MGITLTQRMPFRVFLILIALTWTNLGFAQFCTRPAPHCNQQSSTQQQDHNEHEILSRRHDIAHITAHNPYLLTNPHRVRRRNIDTPECLAPGLQHHHYSCRVSRLEPLGSTRRLRTVTNNVEFHELRFEPRQGVDMTSIPNPHLARSSSCSLPDISYPGHSPAQILQDAARQGCTLHAVTNSALFRQGPTRLANSTPGWNADGMIWSNPSHSRFDSVPGLQAELQLEHWNVGNFGPARIIVVDENGGHEISVQLVPCPHTDRACGRLMMPRGFSPPLNTIDLIENLRRLYPTMTLAIQATGPWGRMDEGEFDHTGNLIIRDSSGCEAPHSLHCSNGRPTNGSCGSTRWNLSAIDEGIARAICNPVPRTLLCTRHDGSVSVITTPRGDLYTLSLALRPGSGCDIECDAVYNFDGGGSTQMAVRSPTHNIQVFGRRVQNNAGQEVNDPQCGPYRGVPYMFAFSQAGCRYSMGR